MALSADERAYQEARLASVESTITNLTSQINAVVTGAQSYTLDTGQTRQTVAKANLTELMNARQRLDAEREEIRMLLGEPSNVGHQTRVVPGW